MHSQDYFMLTNGFNFLNLPDLTSSIILFNSLKLIGSSDIINLRNAIYNLYSLFNKNLPELTRIHIFWSIINSY